MTKPRSSLVGEISSIARSRHHRQNSGWRVENDSVDPGGSKAVWRASVADDEEDRRNFNSLSELRRRSRNLSKSDDWRARKKFTAGVMTALERLRQEGAHLGVRTYTRAMACVAETGGVNDCGDIYRAMVRSCVPPSQHTFGVLLKSIARSTRMSEEGIATSLRRTKAVLYQFRRRRAGPANGHFFAVLLGVYVKIKDRARAHSVIRDMRFVHVNPDKVHLTLLLRLEGTAKGVARRMAEMQDVVPDDRVWENAASGVSRSTEADPQGEIRTVMAMMQSAGYAPTLIVYNCLLNACTRTNDEPGARRVLWHMQKKGLRPNSTSWSIYISVVGRAMADVLPADRLPLQHTAEAAFSKAVRSGASSPHPYAALMSVYAVSGDASGARRLQRKYEERFPPTTVWLDRLNKALPTLVPEEDATDPVSTVEATAGTGMEVPTEGAAPSSSLPKPLPVDTAEYTLTEGHPSREGAAPFYLRSPTPPP
eukprot:Hpha_TRINITY_DN23353_c0_g1::TRINITY_DN23353_c0_g1_i1::g.96896::m.96896